MKMSILIEGQRSRHGRHGDQDGQAEVCHRESVLRRIRGPAFGRRGDLRRGKQWSVMN